MLPLSDDNRGRRTQPIVTWVLIGMNIAIYAWQFTMTNAEHWRFLMDWAVVPDRVSSGQNLHTLVTSAFLHGSWFHLGSNMLFLWIFGDNVEDVLGHIKYLLFYLATAIAAGLAQVLIDLNSLVPMVGASGAVSGLLAAYIVLFPHGRVRTLLTLGVFITVAMLPAWMMIGYWFLLQLLSGLLSLGEATTGGGVAFFAHIGGFLAGLALVRPLSNRARLQHQLTARGRSADPHTWGLGPGRRR